MKVKNINFFVLLVYLATVFAMLSSANSNIAMKAISLGIDVILIVYAIISVGINCIILNLNRPIVIICAIILCANFCISPYEPRYALLLKYFGYFTIYIAGKHLASNGYNLLCSKTLLYILTFTPLLAVAILDKTDMKTTFFANSNVFVYMGLCISLFYMHLNGISQKQLCITLVILSSYILVGTSLGVIVALMGSFLILNLKRVNLFFILGLVVIAIFFVTFSNIAVAVRIRDTIAIYKALDWYDWTHLSDISLYDLQQLVGASGAREDNTSSLWRIVQWTGLIKAYFTNFFNIPFGLGADYTIAKTGLPPHNDHILILVEYGIIVYGALFKGMINIYRKLQYSTIFYLILAIFLYHFTENLIDTFPPNCLFYFVLGFSANVNKLKST